MAEPLTVASRKRIRKFFGKIAEVAEMPNLIEVQKESYDQFLQMKEPAGGRTSEWLAGTFSGLAIAAAARRAQRTGRGDHIDFSISEVMTLEPGDLVLTGTPEGVGTLAPGDVVEVEIAGVSRVSNPVSSDH